MFYFILKNTHNILRWVVLLSALVTLYAVFSGMLRRQAWGMLQRISGLVFSSSVGLQIILGLVLYGISPITTGAMKDMGTAMKNSMLRFYAVEHIFIMILAFVAAQLGYSLSKRSDNDARKYRIAAIGYSLAVLLILAGIPWKYSLLFPAF